MRSRLRTALLASTLTAAAACAPTRAPDATRGDHPRDLVSHPAPSTTAPHASDRDGDHLLDSTDRCPSDAEDADGFEDDDGCPDPDNDRDGVPDVDDRCPDQARVMSTRADPGGCPDPGP